MRNDRFKDFDKEVRDLVLEFERTVVQGESQFFDVDELETIADYYIETGDMGRLPQAVAYATELYPGNTSLEVRRAQMLMAQERYKEAYALLSDLRHREPDNTDVAYSLGICLSGMGEHERAIVAFTEAAADGWQLGRTYSNIAEEYYHLGRMDEAADYYRRSLGADPEDSVVIYNYYDLCYHQGTLGGLVDYYHRLVADHPYCKELWHCLGCAYREQGNYDQAEEAFEYALAADQRFYSAYVDLSISQEEAGRIGDAATTLNRALDCAESRSEVYVMLAALYGRNGNTDISLLYARQAIDADPSNPLAYATIALDYSEVGDHSTAIDFAQQALALGNDLPDALASAAHVYAAAGRADRAEQCFDRLLATECSEQHYLCYALFLSNQGRWNDLMFFCQEMLEMFPRHRYFSTYLAAALFNTNRYNRARRLLPDCDTAMLLDLCPSMANHPLFMQLIQTNENDQ